MRTMRTRVFVLLLGAAGLGLAQTPAISSGGIVNAASFSATTPVTPGSLFTIFGTNLASSAAAADTIPLSKSLGGATVEFVQGSTTYQAPMLFAQPTTSTITSQINAQVPWELNPAQPAQIQVTVGGATSTATAVTLAAAGPGVFASNGNAIAVNSDGTLAWAPGTVPGLTTHGTSAGDTIIVYATGLGAVTPASPADGADSIDELRSTAVTPVVTIGGVSANVSFSGLSPQFVGVYQLNIVVPSGVTAGSSVPLQIQMGSITTANNTVIAVTQ
jgi:minor extracellular serine protease Vpr